MQPESILIKLRPLGTLFQAIEEIQFGLHPAVGKAGRMTNPLSPYAISVSSRVWQGWNLTFLVRLGRPVPNWLMADLHG